MPALAQKRKDRNSSHSRESSQHVILESPQAVQLGTNEQLEEQDPLPSSMEAVCEETRNASTYSSMQKWQIVIIVGCTRLFSPLSSNIYFPALAQISKDFNVSISKAGLTITVYMIIQALAPSVWGPLSDIKGRRIALIGTMIVYLVANIGLAFSTNFAALMVLRGLQSAGSAATVSLSIGVIGDIATGEERGHFIGVTQAIANVGQLLGPVFGGLILKYSKFHTIFWFLDVLGCLELLIILLLLPETLPSIAGAGDVRLKSIYRPWIYISKPKEDNPDSSAVPEKFSMKSFLVPFRFLLERESFCTVFFGSMVYTVWSMATSSTAPLLQKHFHLNNLQIGLVFLPNGAGCIAGSFITGKLSKRIIKRFKKNYEKQDPEKSGQDFKQDDFPFEKIRMRYGWIYCIIMVLSTALYGYSIRLRILALPLILQFWIAYSNSAFMQINQTLMTDTHKNATASSTAVLNLVRCLLGASGVAAVQPLLNKFGAGTTFLASAVVLATLVPLLGLAWMNGLKWRQKRGLKKKKDDVERLRARDRCLSGGTLVDDGRGKKSTETIRTNNNNER
ncbi:major facilitator superfamily domain-containing protein [Halenospora varia]|nr:major facilitator superfamily domain-containing protein [Halenospora varia]